MANRQLRLSSVQVQPAAADTPGTAVADQSWVQPRSRLVAGQTGPQRYSDIRRFQG